MAPLSNPLDELFTTLIARMEEEPGFDVQTFLREHPAHADAMKSRLERLRRVGLLGDVRGESTLVVAMGERFGVQRRVQLPPTRSSAGAGRPVEELLPSHVVGGRYRILDVIGHGGMGRVFRAFDVDLGRHVALKVADLEGFLPFADAAQRRSWIERFLSEAQITAQLEHPSIVPVHDIGIDRAGQLYYTMKLVEGETLEEKIRQWHAALAGGADFPTSELLRIVNQACQAIAFAHERNVVHRDLKPSNVMVGRFGEVQVMDWGLAKLLASSERGPAEVSAMDRERNRGRASSRTLAGEVMGTPTHMAPEQARGDSAAIGRGADVFGLGALLHHGLHGVPPNRAGDASPRDVAPELDAICSKAMHPAPESRYPSAHALAADLKAFLDLRVVRVYEAGTFAELRKWVRRNRALTGALCAVALALAAGLAASLFQRARAVQRGEDVLRLAAFQDLHRLSEEADRLWPLVPEELEAFQLWIERARVLEEELPALRRELELRGSEDSRESRWWAEELRKLIAGLEGLQQGLLAEDAVVPGHGWSVPKRRNFVERLATGFARGGPFARAWDAALPAIRAAYPGLDLSPQLGLVPLGPDPASGLWEFCDLASGDAPSRDAGRLRIDASTGLVLVLLPGGEYVMGAQREDPADSHHDERAESSEAPPHAVFLSPFFLSKYEMTQAQWARAAGANPSYHQGRDWIPGNVWLPSVNPVDTVSWHEARAILARSGLALPTEAQWQYAARAGTSTPWWTGSDPRALAQAANLGDLSLQAGGGVPGMIYEGWEDGRAFPAACGTLAANAFGLHDTSGNVAEWCLDGFDSMYYVRSPYVDPLCAPEGARLRVYCGGSFLSSSFGARSTHRSSTTPEHKNGAIGVRPARAVDGLPAETRTPSFHALAVDGFTLVRGRHPSASREFRNAHPGLEEEDFQAFEPGAPVGRLALGEVDVDVNLVDGSEARLADDVSTFASSAFGVESVMFDRALLNRDPSTGVEGNLEFVFAPPVSAFGAWIFDDLFGSDPFTLSVTEADGTEHRAGPLELTPCAGIEGFVGFGSVPGIRRAVIGCHATFELDHLLVGAPVR
jgi:formylglycine-generating enzyme required for sulfatase activity